MSERWKPEKYERYWIIAFSEVVQSEWRADCADLIRWRMGNCFKTKEEAVDALKKITALLLSLHEPTKDFNQLPKLTAKVFDRPDCPEWCKVGEWIYDKEINSYSQVSEKDVTKYIQEVRKLISKGAVVPARLRPFNTEEMKALVGRTVAPDYGAVFLVTKFVATGEGGKVCVDGIYYDADRLLDEFTIDGKSAGVLEHLNGKGEWVE